VKLKMIGTGTSNLRTKSRELVIGDVRILFSYEDPVAFVDSQGTYYRLQRGTKATINHILEWHHSPYEFMLTDRKEFLFRLYEAVAAEVNHHVATA
jgi:hypothetical protein